MWSIGLQVLAHLSHDFSPSLPEPCCAFYCLFSIISVPNPEEVSHEEEEEDEEEKEDEKEETGKRKEGEGEGERKEAETCLNLAKHS